MTKIRPRSPFVRSPLRQRANTPRCSSTATGVATAYFSASRMPGTIRSKRPRATRTPTFRPGPELPGCDRMRANASHVGVVPELNL